MTAGRMRGWVILLGMGCGLGLLYVVDPSAHMLWPCPVHALTGLSCAGCGMTRAAHALLHGHVAEAVRFNVLSVIVVPSVAVAVVRSSMYRVKGMTAPALSLPRWLEVCGIVVVVTYMVARNIV